jgi:hypothetical protein
MHQRQESGVAAPLKMPSFRFLEHPHALAHQRDPRHHLAAHLAVSHIDLHLLHPPNSLPIPSGYSAVIDAYQCDLMNPADVCAIFEKYGKGDLGCRSHSGAFPSCSLPQPRRFSSILQRRAVFSNPAPPATPSESHLPVPSSLPHSPNQHHSQSDGAISGTRIHFPPYTGSFQLVQHPLHLHTVAIGSIRTMP